jgi:hypothetical protein
MSIKRVKNLAVHRNVYGSLLSGGAQGALHTGILVFTGLMELTVLRKHIASRSTCPGACVHDVPCFSHGSDVTAVYPDPEDDFVTNMERRRLNAEVSYNWLMTTSKNDVNQAGLTQWTVNFNPKIVAKWLCEEKIPENERHL